jgi:hypothetical protein
VCVWIKETYSHISAFLLLRAYHEKLYKIST